MDRAVRRDSAAALHIAVVHREVAADHTAAVDHMGTVAAHRGAVGHKMVVAAHKEVAVLDRTVACNFDTAVVASLGEVLGSNSGEAVAGSPGSSPVGEGLGKAILAGVVGLRIAVVVYEIDLDRAVHDTVGQKDHS